MIVASYDLDTDWDTVGARGFVCQCNACRYLRAVPQKLETAPLSWDAPELGDFAVDLLEPNPDRPE